ncbi:hypothetical protein GCM10017562_09350 [Streptomyces roseofulvus]
MLPKPVTSVSDAADAGPAEAPVSPRAATSGTIPISRATSTSLTLLFFDVRGMTLSFLEYAGRVLTFGRSNRRGGAEAGGAVEV